MPINILRLNQRHQHPTPHIAFIKPLPGPSATQSEAFLSRVAAICHPLLIQHHISVTTLEEHEPNPEFIGRNFNAGEVIQLVLRTRSGGWVPFRHVVMVMMHELAHCKQMNHSRAFWAVRNVYAGDMRELWAKGYTGEGVWGRGRELENGGFEVPEGEWGVEDQPAHLCGGTFRTRGRGKRKRGQLSYAEREKKRIEKKFGVAGEKLGEDEAVKYYLDGGKKIAGKPRVANSARGRELRAAAALVRFGAATQAAEKEEEDIKSEEDDDQEWEDYQDEDAGKTDALDHNGNAIRDGDGKTMVKVCEDEDQDDVHVKQEMDELNSLWSIPEASTFTTANKNEEEAAPIIKSEPGVPNRPPGRKSQPPSAPPPPAINDVSMRSKLDTFHEHGSTVSKKKKGEKKPPPVKKASRKKPSIWAGGRTLGAG